MPEPSDADRRKAWGFVAPALVWMGYIQADPARTARALPMFSCFIVAMGFLDRFQADFALFLNTGLAQVGGIATTLVVSKLFRSASTRWTAYRIVRQNWADLAQMADPRRPLDAATWTARAIDRLGQVATRMAFADPDDALHAVDGLSDLRIGRNIIQAREGLDRGDANTRPAIEAALVAAHLESLRRLATSLTSKRIWSARRTVISLSGLAEVLTLAFSACSQFPVLVILRLRTLLGSLLACRLRLCQRCLGTTSLCRTLWLRLWA